MTISATDNKFQYSGNDSTDTFATPVFFDDTDLVVTLTTTATGVVDAVWVLNTDYTLAGGSGAAGTLTATTAPATGKTLTIETVMPLTQSQDYVNFDGFPADVIEDGFDKIVLMVQKLDERVDSAVARPSTSTDTATISLPDASADNVLGWNAAGDTLVNIAFADLSLAFDTSFASLASGDFLKYDGTNWINETAATARTSLGLGTAAVKNTGTSGDAVPLLNAANTFGATVSFSKGSDIASASTLVLGTDGNYFDVTGTTTITGITVPAGTLFKLQFDAALTLTHGASLDLPGDANITTAAGDILIGFATAANTVKCLDFIRAAKSPDVGKIVQKVITTNNTTSTGTTTIPYDDTIPQNTEGTEVMTLAITPKNTANRLIIKATLNWAHTASGYFAVALFQDATADALATVSTFLSETGADQHSILFYEMAAGTTSATTFKIRAGSSAAGTATFNGKAGARKYGGTYISSIEIIEVET